MQFQRVLETFDAFFVRGGFRYAIIGGLALQAWGHSRFTRDCDFVLERSAREPVVAFAESLGYETLHVSEGYSNHLHVNADFGRVDFMYVDSVTGEQVFGEAVRKPIVGQIQGPVASPEHLLAMKAIAMKNAPERVLIDSPDVKFLLSLSGVDHSKVRDYFSRHGLLEVFDGIERQR